MDHLFRHEYGRLVAILTRQLGSARLPLVEDVAQDALLRAAQVWPYRGLPPNPTAWLLTTARNRARDICRRDQRWQKSEPAITHLIESTAAQAEDSPAATFENEIRDAELRMMFVCCHPGLSSDSRLALFLKTLAGFGEQEIASAFLTTRPTITKRLIRARKFLREENVSTDLPSDAELAERLHTVLHALYLLFNEGFKASTGDRIIREELCREADRLLAALGTWSPAAIPQTCALAALFAFHRARLPARLDDAGDPVILAEQDRRQWDRAQLRRGMKLLSASAQVDQLSRYHIEAGIAACHSLAKSYAATDWSHIAKLYGQLETVAPSPAVSINRAIAIARADGANAGLAHLTDHVDAKAVESYHLFHAARADMLSELNDPSALSVYQRALDLAPLAAERRTLRRRMADLAEN
jgi:RNA polymerase sigma-70 factor (ECF subfamily)